MAPIVLLATLLLAVPAFAGDTQHDMTVDACEKAKKADAELNWVYKQLLGNAASDAKVAERIKAAQRAWVAFRDAQMTALYPPDDTLQGSVMPMCACGVEAELTVDRTAQLRRMLRGEEGDVCSWQRP
jgi:uncharacterized protein YecT (DUF1311 family)